MKIDPKGNTPPIREMIRGLVYHLAAGMGRGTAFTLQGLADDPLAVPGALGRPILRPTTVPTKLRGRITKAMIENTANIVRKGSTREVW